MSGDVVEVEWDYGIVAFLDILGFSSLIKEDANSLVPKHLERLLSFLGQAKKTLKGKAIELRTFSDSIILSTKLGNKEVSDIIGAVSEFQRDLVINGILVRGAIALGKHYSNQNAIYSQALVSAYLLERDSARFPRILVQEDLYDWFSNDNRTTVEQRNFVDKMLLRDRDGRCFINYLSSDAAKAHLDLIEGYRDKIVEATVLEKIQWLAEYHNFVVNSRKLGLPHDGPLVAGFRPMP
jgi:hypothetical protein